MDTSTLPDQNESPQKTAADDPKPDVIKESPQKTADVVKETKPCEGTEVPKQEVDALKNPKPESTPTSEDVSKNESNTGEPKDVKQDDDKETLLDKASLKNKSDIFSLNENKNLPSTIFSVGGAPSKTIHKSSSINSNSSYDSTGNKQGHLRNPLTGIGVCSKDEFKTKPSKRRDGNPLLGVGYKDDDEFFNSPPTTRIPPGGYSKGLW